MQRTNINIMSLKIIGKTTHGIVSKNNSSNLYEIVYKNLSFKFNLEAYDQFTGYIFDLKDAFEVHNSNTSCSCSVIEIPTANEVLHIKMSFKELDELCDLFSLSYYKNMYMDIKNKIDFTYSLN